MRLRVPPLSPGPLRLSKDNFWELRSAIRCSPLDQSVSWLVPSGGIKLMAVPGTPPRAPPLASRPASAAARTAPGQLPGYRPDSSRTGPPTGRCPYSCRPSRARPAVSPMQTPHVAPRRARSSTNAQMLRCSGDKGRVSCGRCCVCDVCCPCCCMVSAKVVSLHGDARTLGGYSVPRPGGELPGGQV